MDGGDGGQAGGMAGRLGDAEDMVHAASHDGVICVQRLEQLGIARSTAARRCRGGPWRRLLPGIVLLNNGEPSAGQRVQAALLHCGEPAMVTGRQACRRHGLLATDPSHEVHVLVPAGRQPSSCGFVVVERTWRLPVPVVRGGVPLAPVARAVLDAARRMRRLDQIRALVAEAVQSGQCSAPELTGELDAGSPRGTGLVRTALREVSAGVRSVAEADARRLVRRSRLPEPIWNVDIHDLAGNRIARPDGWFDDVALAWEIDSYAYHLAPGDYARTLRRDAAMVANGIVVVRTLPARLRGDPRAVLAELSAAHAQARRRPRPPVTPTPAARPGDTPPANGVLT